MSRAASSAEVKHVVVIDVGKTNAKVALVELPSGRELAVRTTANRVLSGPPYPHFDVPMLWQFVLASLAELNAQRVLDAISVTTHGAALALLNADGDLALPVMDYEFDGPDATRAAYDALRAPFSETFSPPLPGGLNAGAQIYWQQAKHPHEFAQVAQVVTYPQFWSGRLSGKPSCEVTSLGCHTDLWRPLQGDFASTAVRLGLDDLMAPLTEATAKVGVLRPEIAGAWSLPAATVVLSGIHDSNASLVPHLSTRRVPFSVVSTGTWVVVMALGSATTELDAGRDTLMNVNLRGDAVPSARFMGGREFSLVAGDTTTGCSDADVAFAVDNRIVITPAIVPGVGPFPAQRSNWRDNTDSLTPGQRFAAMSLYLGMMTEQCLQLVGADGPTIVEGPFATNTAYLDMLANATQRPVYRNCTSATGTTSGAAWLFDLEATHLTVAHCEFEASRKLRDYAAAWRSAIDAEEV